MRIWGEDRLKVISQKKLDWAWKCKSTKRIKRMTSALFCSLLAKLSWVESYTTGARLCCTERESQRWVSPTFDRWRQCRRHVNDVGVSPQNHLRGADLEARHKWKSLHVPVNFTSWDLVTVKHPKCFFSSFFAKSIQFLEVCNAIMTIKLYSLSHFLELEWSLTISFHVVCPHNSNRDEPSPARQIRYLSGCDDDQRPGFVCGCIKWKKRFVMQWS